MTFKFADLVMLVCFSKAKRIFIDLLFRVFYNTPKALPSQSTAAVECLKWYQFLPHLAAEM